MRKIRILLADDHQLFREGVSNILKTQPDFEVVGEASDGVEAVLKARGLKPDLILMDIQMPGCDGVEATKRIKADLPDTTIVMLTMSEKDTQIFDALNNGAQGYLLKTIRSTELLERLRGVMRGEAIFSPEVSGHVLQLLRHPLQGPQPVGLTEDEYSLTQRQREILALVAYENASDQEIAERFPISINTVKTHVRNILSKLQCRNRHEAALTAVRDSLISPKDIPPKRIG
jgi:two-component system NarL family response regulator